MVSATRALQRAPPGGPWSVAVLSTSNLALNLLTVAVFVVASGVQPRWTWLLLPLPLPLVALMIFGTGLAMLLSALYVRFRDVKPIWDVAQQALLYATPILYPVERVAERSDALAKVIMSNRLATIIQEFRHLLLGPDTRTAATAIGGSTWLLIPAAILWA